MPAGKDGDGALFFTELLLQLNFLEALSSSSANVTVKTWMAGSPHMNVSSLSILDRVFACLEKCGNEVFSCGVTRTPCEKQELAVDVSLYERSHVNLCKFCASVPSDLLDVMVGC